MRRISTATRVVNKFGAGKDGFTNGDPVGGIAATDLEDVWFDHVQEEIANFIEAAGLVLDAANRSQLLTAVQALFAAKAGNAAQTFSVAASSASGHAVNQGQVFGVGQAYTNLTGSRSFSTTYTNSTGKPIVAYVAATTTGPNGAVSGLVNGLACSFSVQPVTGTTVACTLVVPAGGTYSVSAGSATLLNWFELR